MGSRTSSFLITAAIALIFGFAGSAAFNATGLGYEGTKEYLLSNPEILPLMAEAYQQQEAERRLASVADQVMGNFPGAVLGNPEGSKVLVKFTDYNCGFCRASLPDIDRLIAEDPELKVVIREWPIFRGSEIASRMGLAAAKQGKFVEFHAAMFELAPATSESVEQAATQAGMDIERAREDIAGQDISTEIAKNNALAARLGFGGTPSWVTGSTAFEGAVGYAALKDAVDNAGT
ncbi:MAG: DsbA family protein [Proteobacteria bacterium]|nr:DsbA family protein [Pseudomonadota bacterium]MDA0915597.1 DsbA family protein [Pseudomonadota bacterium]MDA1033502.1 DsbA family protein [Pseudomonadota bacterium]